MVQSATEAISVGWNQKNPKCNYGPMAPERFGEFIKHLTEGDLAAWPWPLVDHDLDIGRDGIPVPLCEFLAYKSALAYRTGDQIKANLKQHCPGITNVEFFDTKPPPVARGSTQAFGFLYQNCAYIIFRGTSDRVQTKIDIDALLTVEQPGRHRGFATGWEAVKELIDDWIANDLKSNAYPFVFSGHSLGGALSFVAAYDFAANHPDRTVAAVVTFGAPRPGGEDFKDAYNKILGHKTLRIEALGDTIPLLPLRVVGFPYASVGVAWQWDRQPVISPKLVALAKQTLAAALKAAADASDALAVESKKGAEGLAAKPANGAVQSIPEQPPPARSPNSPKAVGDAGAASAAGKAGQAVMLVILGVFVAIGTLLAALWVRDKIEAHAIETDYALFLSTLSYRRLRELRDGDLALANSDLDRHLAFIRGKDQKAFELLFADTTPLPIRLQSTEDLAAFEKLISLVDNPPFKDHVGAYRSRFC